ncbi:preprotein translocase subunit SecF [Candidatus Pacearchaeota archaeon CG_4_9_14_0_2_um_filter_39_13]|nr:protein translocase subunit SecF [Candidatus Pacearchaeota archaeon]OIO43211.1 MAG: hypothetical protein AUJ64_02610 [Candidatus Pacearchaeota archaeon CG1_02_39_14]PJC44908.1 MAG: preprotein translocase subunit SecF [Candidatus Pacearchaeota archaeon CG_4_9_14_0_2_um_filter_39_13]
MLEQEKKNWYDKTYKKMLILSLILILLCVGYLGYFVSQNGDVIYKDVSLTGGTTITVLDPEVDLGALGNFLSVQFPDVLVRGISDLRTGKQQGFFVETSADPGEISPALESYLGYSLNTENSSVEFTGSTISEGFYAQLKFAMILAFIFMALVVFIIFRTPVPSLAVILSAFADIVMTIALLNLLGISLSTGGIVALLMLIGYSVDTDILLTTRVLRKKGESLNSRMYGALKTGLTMTLTSLIAVLVALIVIYTFSDVLRQIFTVLLIGLGFDIFNTWITNASILKWYAEAKGIQ